MEMMETLETENQETKHSDFPNKNKTVIVSFAVGFGIIVYMIILFLVPRCQYLSTKKNIESEKPKAELIVFYFLMHIFLAIAVTSLFILILPKCNNSFSESQTFNKICVTIMIYGFFTFTVTFYLISLIFHFTTSYNPSKSKSPNDIRKLINMSKNSNLMGYCYGKHKGVKKVFYSTPLVFKLNSTSSSTGKDFDDYDFPEYYAYHLKYTDTKDQNTEDFFNECINTLKGLYKNKNLTPSKIYHGIYPEFQDRMYVSKNGKLGGKYSQVSRVFIGIFGIPTIYDHFLKSMETFATKIKREINCTDTTQIFDTTNFNPNLKEYSVDLSMYYKIMYPDD